jgi:hypothetical protein
MGGDDSQKLLPWRGSYSPPGRKPPARLQNQYSSSEAMYFGAVIPALLASASTRDAAQLAIRERTSNVQRSSCLRECLDCIGSSLSVPL